MFKWNEWAQFRSGRCAHARHAIPGGTNLAAAEAEGCGGRVNGGPAAVDRHQKRGPAELKNDMRQRIVRTRGHVAPARSLC